ncbi:MAG: hypothetical protein ACKOA8_14330, partial [Deltaproteobacteria bacterium]
MKNHNSNSCIETFSYKPRIAIILILLFSTSPQAYGLGNLGMILEKFNFLNPNSWNWNWGSTKPKYFVFVSDGSFVGAAPVGPHGTHVNVDFKLFISGWSYGFSKDRDSVNTVL